MAILNKVFSTLLQGAPTTLRETTKFDPRQHPERSLLEVLVPPADPDTMGYRAERLVQLARASMHSPYLDSLDPLNTLSRPLSLPEAGRVYVGAPTGVRLEFSDEREKLEGRYRYQERVALMVDGVGGTYSLEGEASQPLVITGGRTQLIEVAYGRWVRLYGALPASTFTIDIEYTSPVLINWAVVPQRIKLLGAEIPATYADLRASAENSVSFVDVLSAYILYASAVTPWP
ncbi:MAG TPA: hypothetical protein VM537_15465 [Anaerolineae bacterium]|nr:hypothetical protein [Anaerolineae bacterium]